MNRIIKYFKNIINDIKESKNKKYTALSYLITPIITVFIIEVLSRKSFLEAFSFIKDNPIAFLSNVLILMLTLSFTLLMKKRIAGIVIVNVAWLFLGFTNYLVTSNRTTPFTFVDFFNIDSAIGVINQYVSFISIVIAIAGTSFLIAVLVYIWKKVPIYDKKINYFRNIVVIFVISIGNLFVLNLGNEKGVLTKEFPNLVIAFEDYGFIYCFSNSVVNRGIEEPDNYSSYTIENIKTKLNAVKNKEVKGELPNIIFLQLETFLDVNYIKGLEFSKEPLPNFNKFKKEFPSGLFSVHNVGFGTANTEFEIMTGMNLDDFGPGEFPFKTILKSKNCESISYNLKEHGYKTHAMHNNTGLFYSRNQIFSQLGYDNYISIEFMNNIEYTPMGWAKDKVLTNEIKKVLDHTDTKDFIYTISTQGHGSYPVNIELENKYIEVTGNFAEDRLAMLEYYTNMLHEMDMFIKELTDELSKRDEKTILVMYGDHLPSLNLSEEELDGISLYQTEYVVWNNFDLKMKDEDIEAFQLSSKILESLNIQSGVINKFHQTFKKDPEYTSALKVLEYDILYGDLLVYDGINPYVSTELKMGLKEVEITDVKHDIQKGYVLVNGENFTEFSVVFVNDEKYETEFIDTQTLKIYYEDIAGLDSFIVKQMWKSTPLLTTTEYLYFSTDDGNGTIPEDKIDVVVEGEQ